MPMILLTTSIPALTAGTRTW